MVLSRCCLCLAKARPLDSSLSGCTHGTSLLSYLSLPSAVLVTVWTCSMLESQEILTSSPLRTMLRAQGLRDPWHGAEHNYCREGRGGQDSWLPPYFTQVKDRGWIERCTGATQNDGEWASICFGALWSCRAGLGLLQYTHQTESLNYRLSLNFSHSIDFQW